METDKDNIYNQMLEEIRHQRVLLSAVLNELLFITKYCLSRKDDKKEE